MAQKPGPKPGRTAAQTRKLVHVAARNVLVTQGLRAVSPGSVKEVAGVSGSTVLGGKTVPDLLAEITVRAFTPLLDAFTDPGSTDKWLLEAELKALALFRAEPSLALHVTQVCGLAGEAPRKPGHLNDFTGLYRDVAQQLAAAFARDRAGCDATWAGKRLLRFYMSAALHLSVWPMATDEDVLESIG